MGMTTTKAQAIEAAALTLRVFARQHGRPVTAEMAWGAIAVLGDLGGVTLSAKDVLRVARRELRVSEEGHLA